MQLSSEEVAAAKAVLNVLEARIQELSPSSQLRGVLDDWAQQLSTNPPGWVPSKPA